ncbi:hypothetical protein BDV11DRAFT_211539 [Aspergillus similis]
MRTTKRASKACAWCHERKVRCDAVVLRRPCTRCQQDGQHCVMQKRAPRVRVDAAAPYLDLPNHVPFSLYPFLELEGFASLTPEDTAFFHSKGCLQVPAKPLLDDVVRQYFLNIQPVIPEESSFWSLYEQENYDLSTPKCSLLLFQALLFASSPYISLETAQNIGFQDARDASDILFHLQSAETPLVRARAALLLAFHTSSSEPLDASRWFTHAIHAATEATLNLEAQEIVTEEERSKHNRLWWSIVLRDRSLSLGLRRRPQISLLKLGMIRDNPEEKAFEDEIMGSQVYDPVIKRELFKIFRAEYQLAVPLTEMVSLVFGMHGISQPSLSVQRFYETLEILGRIKISLQLWKEQSQLADLEKQNAHYAVVKFTQMAIMYYESARVSIAHFEALLIERHHMYTQGSYMQQLSYTAQTLYNATTNLISVLKYFSQNSRRENLPLPIVACLEMPLIICAINFKLSPTQSEMADRRLTLDYIGELMSRSRLVYEVSEVISLRINDILRLAYLMSQHVFLQDRSVSLPAAASPTPEKPGKKKGPISNWHDAFLRHPRAYLLIATTVDYYMAVGRLPQNNTLPDIVSVFPPLGRISLPWSSQVDLPRIDLDWRLAEHETTTADTTRPCAENGSSKDRAGPRSGRETQNHSINLDYLDLNICSVHRGDTAV